jgi:hypothetical protein
MVNHQNELLHSTESFVLIVKVASFDISSAIYPLILYAKVNN